jgi:hypothetical protein
VDSDATVGALQVCCHRAPLALWELSGEGGMLVERAPHAVGLHAEVIAPLEFAIAH